MDLATVFNIAGNFARAKDAVAQNFVAIFTRAKMLWPCGYLAPVSSPLSILYISSLSSFLSRGEERERGERRRGG